MTSHNEMLDALFQEGLEAISRGRSAEDFLAQHPDKADELRPLFGLAAQMSTAMGAVQPRAAARAATLQRVREQARASRHSPLANIVQFPVLSRAFGALAASLFILVVTSTGAVAVSASALPGDPLYDVKTGFENVQVFFSFDDTARARVYAELASNRTGEIEALAEMGRPVPLETIEALETQTAAAVDQAEKAGVPVAVTQKVVDITNRQQKVLPKVAEKAPKSAPAVNKAIKKTESGRERAQAALDKAKAKQQDDAKAARATSTAAPAATRDRGRTAIPTSPSSSVTPGNAPPRDERESGGRGGSQPGAPLPSTTPTAGNRTQERGTVTATPTDQERRERRGNIGIDRTRRNIFPAPPRAPAVDVTASPTPTARDNSGTPVATNTPRPAITRTATATPRLRQQAAEEPTRTTPGQATRTPTPRPSTR